MPSGCDAKRAIIAGTAFMKDKDRKPSHEDKNGYEPSGHHLTDRLAQANRPALSADAISRQGSRLHFALGAGDAEMHPLYRFAQC